MLWDWPCRGTPFTLHVIVGWGIPLAEHLMSTFEPIILSWLSGSDTHSGGSEKTRSARYYQTDDDVIVRKKLSIYTEWTQSQKQLCNTCYSIQQSCCKKCYISRSAHDRLTLRHSCLLTHQNHCWHIIGITYKVSIIHCFETMLFIRVYLLIHLHLDTDDTVFSIAETHRTNS